MLKPSSRILAPCEDCGVEYDATAQARIDAFAGRRGPRRCQPCNEKRLRLLAVEQAEAHQRRLAYWRQRWIDTSGIPDRYRGKGLDSFEVRWRQDGRTYDNSDIVGVLREWAEAFPAACQPDGTYQAPKGYRSLALVSRHNGVGKTHLACALLAAVLSRMECLDRERSPGLFLTGGELRRRVSDAQRYGSAETTQDVYRHLGAVPLLVLDDVGRERPTGAEAATAYEVYYTLVNERYNRQLPLVLTSNLGMEPWEPGGASLVDVMGLAGVSRLREMCAVKQYEVKGVDRR